MTNKRKFSAKHTIATLGSSLFLFCAIVAGGSAGFINLPSFMITFGIPFFLLYGIHGSTFPCFLVDGCLTLFSTPPRREINKTYQQIIVQFSRYTIGAGVLGTLIGMVQMLHSMSDPSSIGAGMAVSLITVLYAVIASEVYLAFLYFAYADKSDDLHPISSKSTMLATGIVAMALVLFFVMLLAFSVFEGNLPRSAGSIDVSVVIPSSTAPILLTTWFSTDAPEALNIIRQHTNSLGNAASEFLQSVATDQIRSPITEKKLELTLIDAATSLLKAQSLTNTVLNVSICNLEISER